MNPGREHLHVTVDRKIFGELLNVWKVEQGKALKNGETIFKSAIAELILKMGIKEYYKTLSIQKPEHGVDPQLLRGVRDDRPRNQG